VSGNTDFETEILTSSKIPKLRLEIRDRDTKLQNFYIFSKCFLKMSSSLLACIFFQISGIFPTCFGCFLPANWTNRNR